MSEPSASWEEFAGAVAAAGSVEPGRIEPTARLIGDLGLDSLALAEVVVMLIVEFEMVTLSDGLDDHNWDALTVGELYEEYRSGRPVRSAADFTVRLDR